MKASVAEAARLFTPAIVASLISVGALLAAATSLNGILLAISREVYALAEDRIFPRQLGELRGRHNIPMAAILTVAGVGFIGTAVGVDDHPLRGGRGHGDHGSPDAVGRCGVGPSQAEPRAIRCGRVPPIAVLALSCAPSG